jgi:hypothetical protein
MKSTEETIEFFVNLIEKSSDLFYGNLKNTVLEEAYGYLERLVLDGDEIQRAKDRIEIKKGKVLLKKIVNAQIQCNQNES